MINYIQGNSERKLIKIANTRKSPLKIKLSIMFTRLKKNYSLHFWKGEIHLRFIN
jgi:hypothetical protein